MNYDTKRSGMYIKSLRIQNGYTQEELASALNIDRSFFSHIESGKKGCSVDLLVRLSNLFDVSLDSLVFGMERYSLSAIENTETLKADIDNLITHLGTFKDCL